MKNLTRSKRRTVLTVISIAVSLFIFSALVSLPTVANEILADTASSVRIAVHNKAGLTYALPEAYKTRIATTPHVVAVVPESWFGGIYHEVSDAFPNLAVDPEQAEAMWPDWGVGKASLEEFQPPAHRGAGGCGDHEAFQPSHGAANHAARHGISDQRHA